MNKQIFTLSILLTIAYTNGTAQIIRGKITETESNTAIPYVNIGILNRGLGTVSNPNGEFEIDISKISMEDSIKFSSIGYLSKQFALRDFKNQFGSMNYCEVGLAPHVTVLHEVTINSKSSKSLRFGHSPKSRFTKAGFTVNRLGHEIGTLFEREESSILKLDSVQLNFVSCTYDSLFIRLNVYDVHGDDIQNILPENVFVHLSRKEALAKPIIDLTQYQLMVGKKYLISIELVKDLGELGLKFYASLKADRYPTFYRLTSHDAWKKAMHHGQPLGISMIAFAH
jgi:CarboxypepD_reg-like domain